MNFKKLLPALALTALFTASCVNGRSAPPAPAAGIAGCDDLDTVSQLDTCLTTVSDSMKSFQQNVVGPVIEHNRYFQDLGNYGDFLSGGVDVAKGEACQTSTQALGETRAQIGILDPAEDIPAGLSETATEYFQNRAQCELEQADRMAEHAPLENAADIRRNLAEQIKNIRP